MKNKYDLFTFIKIISMLIMFPVTLSASGISIGGIMSVYDDGPFNAVKNPALLTRTDTSIGAILYGSPYAKGKTTLFEINGVDTGSNKTDSRKTFSSNLSFVKSSKKISFGLSLALQDDDNYSSRKSSGTYSGSDRYSDNEKSNAIGSYLSAGYKMTSDYSIGLRMYCAYKNEKKDEKEFQIPDNVTKSNIKSLNISPALGFHANSRRNKYEIGIILSGGTFTKKKYDFSYYESDSVNGKNSSSSGFEITKSPSITLGVLKRYKKSSLIAETAIYIPTKHDDKTCSIDISTGDIKIEDIKRSNSFRFEQKLGYEYSFSSSSAFSCGLGYLQIRQKEDFSTLSESIRNNIDVRAFIFSLGFDKKISGDTKILLACSNYVIFNKLESKSGVFSIKIDSYELLRTLCSQ
ncbi:MAG: hypothetical protein KA015_05175 [Spirochaetes bacterium]|nr:hypothetical protein [Spirochaetota bacterium]